MNVNEKVVIVTGARSGIGLATAIRFANEGAKVVVADVRDARQEVGEMAKRRSEALFIQADVSIESQVAALLEKAVAAFGRVDVLVNNAGMELAKTVTDTTEAEWERLMNVNLKGVFLCSKATIPVMQRGGGGVIVNVASELGLVGGSEIAAYAASKGGVVQLTKAMAIDHIGDGIRVNCVAPGPVSTPLLEQIIESSSNPEEERKGIVGKTLLKRLARPEEIANVIVFLASDEASYMTGAIVSVDGGWTAH
jgi:NAD(P)-dependent dehydrogenase (short-subunit alcohol dehydrogenase family)